MPLLDEFQNSLDRAIARTASVEFDRLRAGLGAASIAGHIKTAMKELRKLQQIHLGRMPDYHNPWVAPFYTSWYQPRQVMAACGLIQQIMTQQGGRLTRNAAGNLCVVDFGCGASATRFGLTLAVADAIEGGQSVGRIEVYGTDISQPLVKMGNRLWRDWGEEIANSNEALRTAYDKIEAVNKTVGENENWNPPEPSSAGSDRWLVALHTAYLKNRTVVRGHLRHIADAFSPMAGFATSHFQNRATVRYISPFNDPTPLQIRKTPGANCPETTDWRSEIEFEFVEHLKDIDSGYLHNRVSYSVEPTFCLLYVT